MNRAARHIQVCSVLAIRLATFLTCLWVAAPSHAQGLSALPAVWRVPLAEDSATSLRLAPSMGYGYTESVLPGSDEHHRLLGSAGVGLTTRAGLAFEARLLGRYDFHTRDGHKQDSGGLLDPRLAVRYSHSLGRRLLGLAQVGAWIPGSKAPVPSFPATTLDALLALTFLASARTQLAGFSGYRFDRSAESIAQPSRLSTADWLALGVSQYDAALVGVGARNAVGTSSAWFAELTWDILVGERAPAVTDSPLRLGLGASTALGPMTRGTVGVEILLSGRPEAATTAPLVPFEPRVTAMVGITQSFDFSRFRRAEPSHELRAVSVTREVSAPAPHVGVMRVMVRDPQGEPLTATVLVIVQGESAAVLEASAVNGVFETELSPGPVEIHISAPGFWPQQRRVLLDEQGVTVVNVDLKTKDDKTRGAAQ